MKSLERLRLIPWAALRGLEDELGPALDQVLSGSPADRVLDRWLRRRRALSAEQRTAVAEAVFGVGLWRRRLAVGRPGAGGRALLDALVAGMEAERPTGFADRYSLPDWLAELLLATAEPEALADALNLPGPVCLRANTLRTSRQALADRLAAEGVLTRPGQWARDALVITSSRPNLYGLGAWNEGLFEVQDEGSQLLGELLALAPGEEVIDLCAGAGGKTLQLSAWLDNRGAVHATDLDLARLERLRVRAANAGATAVRIHGKALPPDLRAAAVLVDAPCSELGALRRGPDLRWRLAPADFARFPALQLGLLETALGHLAPGGRLVYATCTFRPEENEQVADAFLARHPELRLLRPAVDPSFFDPKGHFRAWPHLHGTDAFFASVYRRQ